MNSLASPRGLGFESLVHEHQGTVYHVALRVLRDPAGAEDVAQQVFLRLFQEQGIPGGITSPRAYVARAAVNAALNALRARERRCSHEKKATPRRSTPMSPTDAVLQAEVRAAVDELPVEQRLAVVLHFFQGLTHAEVAESLDVPAGTVASRIHAAVGRLREALAGAGVLLVAGALEGALEAAESDPVPSELTEKLLRIPLLPPPAPIAPAVAPAGGAIAAALASAMYGPFAIAMLVLATLGIALLAAVRLAQPTSTRTASTSSGPSLPTLATYFTPPTAPIDTPGPPIEHDQVVDSSAANEEELVTIEGFLVRREDGSLEVYLEYSDGAPHPPSSTPYVLVPESEKAFAGVPLGGTCLSSYLAETVEPYDAPRVYVRLTGTARNEGEKPRPEDSFPERSPISFTTRDCVAVDYLTDGWLAECERAWSGLRGLDLILRQPPTPGRRGAVIAEAQSTLRAVEEMRRQRGLEAVPAGILALKYDPYFRRKMERDILRRLSGVTIPYGVTLVGLPGIPTAEELRRAFLEARDQAELRSTILASYGEGALEDSVTLAWATHGLRDVISTWTPEMFLCMQERARAAIEESPGEDASSGHPEDETYREHVRSAGLDVEGLGDIDRQTWLVSEGVKVVAVTHGSRAERAGLRVGDLLWRVHVGTDHGGRVVGEKLEPLHLSNLGAFLDQTTGLDTVKLDVLRDGRCVEVRLSLK